jgi:hypothetical protein
VLKLLKFSLYHVLNEKFQYGDLEAPWRLLYPVVRPSMWFPHLVNTLFASI